MDAFLPPLLAAFLAEWGDRTQLLAMMLALRFRGSPQVLGGIALAAAVNAAISAFAGSLLATIINFQAISLMTALALMLAGGAALLPQRPPRLGPSAEQNALWASFLAFLLLGFGDKTQFLTMTLAARAHAVPLTAMGAAIGVVLANAPAVFLGDRLPAVLPLRMIRIAAGILLLMAGVIGALLILELA